MVWKLEINIEPDIMSILNIVVVIIILAQWRRCKLQKIDI